MKQQHLQRHPSCLQSLLQLAVVAGLLLNWTWAWAPAHVIQNKRQASLGVLLTRRWAEPSDDNTEAPAAPAAAADEEKEIVAPTTEAAAAAAAPLATASAENPDVIATKQEIAKLEEQLKSKHREILSVKDLAEEFSNVGYARKVAEMENMRRFRSQLQSSNEFSAIANVVTEFLPILDELKRLKALYQDDAFGKNYNALAGNFQTALLELGVEEFTVDVGTPIDGRRVLVLESEYSDKFPKNTVVRPLKLGLELKGNVIRCAECVASLGSEAEAVAAAAAKAAAAAAAAEKAAAAEEAPAADAKESAAEP